MSVDGKNLASVGLVAIVAAVAVVVGKHPQLQVHSPLRQIWKAGIHHLEDHSVYTVAAVFAVVAEQ